MGAARADVGAIGDEGDLGVERNLTECELTTPDELEDDMSSVSHTTSATGQPVYWKSKLLQTQSFREHADLVRNVSKEAVGDSCPFCSSTFVNTSVRNRHFRKHCTVLKANKRRFKGSQKGDTSPSTSGSIIQKRRSKQAQPSIIVQSSRVEEPQLEPALTSRDLIISRIKNEIIALEKSQKESLNYINKSRFVGIYFLEDNNTKEMEGYNAHAGPLRKLLEEHFRDLYQDPLHTEFDRRNRNACFEKEEFRTLFHENKNALRAAEKAREKKKKGQVTTSSGLPSYKSGR
jgi:hypothetical protein